ncbi:MAG TPA: hypothetical protein PLN96_16175, partial [Zoogloea sp.]|uniref:hypothetical protein n=1 Tax=Zoogloea sp. TaxID=49181 RepID=UPI002C885510
LRIDWPAGLRAAERAAFTAHRFHSVFGDMGTWAILADQGAVGFPSLACAIPAALVAAIDEAAQSRTLRVASLQPAYVSDFNRCRGRFRDDGAFARLETARITVGLWGDGRWRAFRSHPVELADAAAAGRCLTALLKTLPLEDLVPAGTLYTRGGDAVGPDALPAGWRGEAVEDAP